ncbi:MAG: hypothetical protein JSV86_12130 [Gemmatimonadota bacterium]|nr:MAG: hypothetical protein JSV86_12130 [Gemmatimonadota bacterium]
MVGPFALQELGHPADPVAASLAYAQAGADEIMLVARSTPPEVLREVVERVAPSLSVPLACWTELMTGAQVGELLAVGASRVAIQKAALADPELIATCARSFGSEAIAVAVAAGGVDDGWRVFEGHGGAASEWDALTWACVIEAQNGGEIIIESPAGGAEGGPFDLELLQLVSSAVARPVVAAGEAGQVEDLFDALMVGDADAVLVSSLLHSGEATLSGIKAFLDEHGLPVQL